MVVVVVYSFYIIFVVFSVAVGAVHQSRVVSKREVVGIRKGVITGFSRYVGWGRGIFLVRIQFKPPYLCLIYISDRVVGWG